MMAAPSAPERDECKMDDEHVKQQLHEAAKTGDIEGLHELIKNHPEILDYKSKPFAETALHIAAHHGKAIFAVEVAIFNPYLKQKLNPSGLTPLHVALISQQWKTAQALTALDVALIRVKGSGGKTALHVAAEIAPPDLLAEFLYACPESFEDITSRWETAVHRSLKTRNLKNFMVLFNWMVTARKEYVLEWKDFKGNTALHLAAAKRWNEVVEIVVRYVPRERKNYKGETAEQVLLAQPAVAGVNNEDTLRLLTSFKICNLIYELQNNLKGHFMTPTILTNLTKKTKLEKWVRFLGFPQVNTEEGMKSRDVVLLVATLIATATYTAILTPPGGYWQDDSTLAPVSSPSAPSPHSAGQLIMHGLTLFSFTTTNAVAFCFAVAAIVLNVVQLKQAVLLTIAIYVLLFNYMSTVFLSISIGKYKKSLLDSPWHYYPESILPTGLLLISLFYAFIGTYVAVNNKFVNVMDSCARRSVPVFDTDRVDDLYDDEEEEEEYVQLHSVKMGD